MKNKTLLLVLLIVISVWVLLYMRYNANSIIKIHSLNELLVLGVVFASYFILGLTLKNNK